MPLPLYEYVDDMSADELETATLDWERIEASWMSESRLPQKRVFDIPHERSVFHLVRGGRWLLASDGEGSILAYDLDIPDATPHIIIPSRPDRKEVWMLVVHHPDTHPLSNFLLGIRYFEWRTRLSATSIWEVGDLGSDSLSTSLLASFDGSSHDCVPPVSLSEEYLAMVDYSDHFYCEVYDWNRSSASSHFKTGFQVSRHPVILVYLILLPGY
ncbi:hypothetical protein ONZ45_g18821 [Pleurotus djamor]|nr:hypothetical protein ONZ45_g18821 [Pleurotus djamor]